MDLMQAITTRRNIKDFKPDPIDMDLIRSWLEAATYAPNHRMVEPWEILIIGEQTRAKLNHKANFGGAPVVLAVLSKSASTVLDQEEQIVATACFVQNFLLAAHAAGAGVRWASLGALPHNREILGVPEGYAVIGVFGVGYPASTPAVKERTPISQKIRYTP